MCIYMMALYAHYCRKLEISCVMAQLHGFVLRSQHRFAIHIMCKLIASVSPRRPLFFAYTKHIMALYRKWRSSFRQVLITQTDFWSSDYKHINFRRSFDCRLLCMAYPLQPSVMTRSNQRICLLMRKQTIECIFSE